MYPPCCPGTQPCGPANWSQPSGHPQLGCALSSGQRLCRAKLAPGLGWVHPSPTPKSSPSQTLAPQVHWCTGVDSRQGCWKVLHMEAESPTCQIHSPGLVATQLLSLEPEGNDARGEAWTGNTGQGAWSGACVKGLVFLAPIQSYLGSWSQLHECRAPHFDRISWSSPEVAL